MREYLGALVLYAYAFVAAIVLGIAWLVTMHAKNKRLLRGFAIALVAALPVWGMIDIQWNKFERERQLKAQLELFAKRCATSGEKIYEKPKGVDGIFIMKPRIKPGELLYQSQFEMWDPYGTSRGEAYDLDNYLRSGKAHATNKGYVPQIKGFKFVEAMNPDALVDSSKPKYLRISYRLDTDNIEHHGTPLRESIPEQVPVDQLKSRYGITWEDTSTKEDRQHWIAGGKLTVVELSTGRVVAERQGYLRDPGLGNTNQNRSIWLVANSYGCPSIVQENRKDMLFLVKVFGLEETGPQSGADHFK